MHIPLSRNKALFLILLGSLILKGFLVFSVQVPCPDGIIYINAAREFSRGNFSQGMQIFPMPFYPLLISLVHTIIPSWLRAGQTVSWLSLVLATIPLYQITEILFDRKAAFWSIIAYTLAPHFNTYASHVIRGPLGLFMLAMGVLFALQTLGDKRIRNFYLVSFFSLLAFFSRVETFLFPLFLIFIYLIIIVFDYRQSSFVVKGAGAFLTIPVATGIIFWLLSGKSFSHAIRLPELGHYFRLMVSKDYLINYHTIYRQLKIMGKSLPHPFYSGNFAETARHYIWFIYLIALVETITILIFPTNIIPLVYQPQSVKYNRSHFFIIGIIVLFAGSSYFFLISNNFIQKRYLIIPVFFLFPWIGNGLQQLYNKVHSCKNRKKLAAGLFILIFLFAPLLKTFRAAGEHNISLKEAGIWLRQHVVATRDIILISNDKRIPFFADLDNNYILMPSENRQQIESFARENKGQIISLVISRKRKNMLPVFKDYKVVKEFHDQKNTIIIAVDSRKKSFLFNDDGVSEQQEQP